MDVKNKKMLVIGGAGLIGSHVVEELLATEVAEVVVYDNFVRGRTENLAEALKECGIRISMDGKGRWLENVFIERLWWSLKYEDIYLRSYATPRDVATGVSACFTLYNEDRPHSALKGATPNEVHRGQAKEAA